MTFPEPDRLSRCFRVRRLTEADLKPVYDLCATNPQYYACCGVPLTMESLRADLTLLPPGCVPAQKHFLGYWDEAGLAAILDLVADFPVPGTAYIGLFMVDARRAGRGLGTALIGELRAALQGSGCDTLRLAYGKNNPQSARFWTRNGFLPAAEKLHPDFGPMVIAERGLG